MEPELTRRVWLRRASLVALVLVIFLTGVLFLGYMLLAPLLGLVAPCVNHPECTTWTGRIVFLNSRMLPGYVYGALWGLSSFPSMMLFRKKRYALSLVLSLIVLTAVLNREVHDALWFILEGNPPR